MTIPVTPGDAQTPDMIVPISGKVGATKLPAIPLDANTTILRVELDPSTMLDPTVFVKLSFEVSGDMGQTWSPLGNEASGHWGGCEVFEDFTEEDGTPGRRAIAVVEDVLDEKGQPVLDPKTGKPQQRHARDAYNDGMANVRVNGLPCDSAGTPFEFWIEQPVTLKGFVGIPMFRGVVTSYGSPLSTTARARKG